MSILRHGKTIVMMDIAKYYRAKLKEADVFFQNSDRNKAGWKQGRQMSYVCY